MRSRYAPSPTGFLHLGNARTALAAYWHARAHGGHFVLRSEDLDRQRSRPEFTRANLAELRWLGLEWDEGPDVGGPFEPYAQSERFGLYEEALGTLEAQGDLFACFLSRKDLQGVASAPHGAPPLYGDTQRKLNEALKAQKRAEGKVPSLRFRVSTQNAQTVAFTDLLAGQQRFDAVGDFVVRRADGQWAYQLAVVVDDIAMNITHVLRGDDLLPSTGAQLLLYNAFGAAPPEFLHLPLLLDSSGARMAKRKGSLTLTALREAGVKPKRVVGLLAYSLGLLKEPAELSAQDLIGTFSLSQLRRKAFRLGDQELEWLYG